MKKNHKQFIIEIFAVIISTVLEVFNVIPANITYGLIVGWCIAEMSEELIKE